MRAAASPVGFAHSDDERGVLSKGLGFPVTQSVAALLTEIMEHKGNLKGSSINKVLSVAQPLPAVCVIRYQNER